MGKCVVCQEPLPGRKRSALSILRQKVGAEADRAEAAEQGRAVAIVDKNILDPRILQAFPKLSHFLFR
jgi:hypothetical protein